MSFRERYGEDAFNAIVRPSERTQLHPRPMPASRASQTQLGIGLGALNEEAPYLAQPLAGAVSSGGGLLHALSGVASSLGASMTAEDEAMAFPQRLAHLEAAKQAARPFEIPIEETLAELNTGALKPKGLIQKGLRKVGEYAGGGAVGKIPALAAGLAAGAEQFGVPETYSDIGALLSIGAGQAGLNALRSLGQTGKAEFAKSAHELSRGLRESTLAAESIGERSAIQPLQNALRREFNVVSEAGLPAVEEIDVANATRKAVQEARARAVKPFNEGYEAIKGQLANEQIAVAPKIVDDTVTALRRLALEQMPLVGTSSSARSLVSSVNDMLPLLETRAATGMLPVTELMNMRRGLLEMVESSPRGDVRRLLAGPAKEMDSYLAKWGKENPGLYKQWKQLNKGYTEFKKTFDNNKAIAALSNEFIGAEDALKKIRNAEGAENLLRAVGKDRQAVDQIVQSRLQGLLRGDFKGESVLNKLADDPLTRRLLGDKYEPLRKRLLQIEYEQTKAPLKTTASSAYEARKALRAAEAEGPEVLQKVKDAIAYNLIGDELVHASNGKLKPLAEALTKNRAILEEVIGKEGETILSKYVQNADEIEKILNGIWNKLGEKADNKLIFAIAALSPKAIGILLSAQYGLNALRDKGLRAALLPAVKRPTEKRLLKAAMAMKDYIGTLEGRITAQALMKGEPVTTKEPTAPERPASGEAFRQKYGDDAFRAIIGGL